MAAAITNRFLDPGVLAGLGRLDLVAKTVVDGFVAGLHRSPDFGFSQEFAEYRAYTPGDDLRHVDWNVFARTERAYLKRYRGETNTAADGAAGRQRQHGLRLRTGYEAGLCEVSGILHRLSCSSATRRGGADCVSRRCVASGAPVHAAGSIDAVVTCH